MRGGRLPDTHLRTLTGMYRCAGRCKHTVYTHIYIKLFFCELQMVYCINTQGNNNNNDISSQL